MIFPMGRRIKSYDISQNSSFVSISYPFRSHCPQLYQKLSTELVGRLKVLLWVALEWRAARKPKNWASSVIFFLLQQSCVLKHISNALLLLLNQDLGLVLLVDNFFLEDRRGVAIVSLLFTIFDDYVSFPHFFAPGVRSLNCRVPDLFAFALVELTDFVNVPDKVCIDF